MIRLENIRRGGHVERFHTVPTVSSQNNAAHSWGVATILFRICPKPSMALIKAALYHDVPECETGDLPAPAKWADSGLSEAVKGIEHTIKTAFDIHVALTSEEELWLSAADKLEGMFYCLEQRKLGNKNMDTVFERWSNAVAEGKFMPLKGAGRLAKELRKEYHNVSK